MTGQPRDIHGKVMATFDGNSPRAVFRTQTQPDGIAGFQPSKSGPGYEATLPNDNGLKAGDRATVVVGEFGALALMPSQLNRAGVPGYVEPDIRLRGSYPSPLGDQKLNGGYVAPRLGAQSSRRS